MRLRSLGMIALLAGLLLPVPAHATQTHGGPEGLVVHQFAHLFFIFSMGLFIYWLRKRRLVSDKGWRYIQYAALFFIFWNLDAYLSHWLSEQSNILTMETIQDWQFRISTAPGLQWLGAIYYLTKLDHLLCVPAMLFLLLGLRRLYHASSQISDDREPAP